MANDAQMIATLAKYATNNFEMMESAMNVMQALTIFFTKMLEQEDVRRQILEFYNVGLNEEKKLREGEKLEILSYRIEPEYAKAFNKICERDGIGHINAQSNVLDLVTDGKGDTVNTKTDSVWIYNTQEKEFMAAIAEAKAISGYEIEMPREIVNSFQEKMKRDGYELLEIKGLNPENYISLRRDIQKLDRDMRFTLYPKFYNDPETGQEKVDVGFLNKTTQLYDKKGNEIVDPKSYNVPEIVRGLMTKQYYLDSQVTDKSYLAIVGEYDSKKKDVINNMVRMDQRIVLNIKKELENMTIDSIRKSYIEKMLNNYQSGKISKTDLKESIENLKGIIPNENGIELMRKINQLESDRYIVPVKIEREEKETVFKADLSQSMCLNKSLTIRTAGKDDLEITDREAIIANLEKKLIDYTEKGKDQSGEYSFVILNKKEFEEIEYGNPGYIGKNHKLNKNKIGFFHKYENGIISEKNPDLSYREEKAQFLIDEINRNKERFMLESDSIDYKLDRFEEHPHATIETIIEEQNHEEEKDLREEEKSERDSLRKNNDIYEEMKNACEESKNVKIEPAFDDFNFDEYIENQTNVKDRNKTVAHEKTSNILDRTDYDENEIE